MKNVFFFLVALFFLFPSTGFSEDRFVLASPDRQAVICVAATEPECVRLAVEDLVGDVRKITGIDLKTTDRYVPGQAMLLVGTLGVAESDAVRSAWKMTIPPDFASRRECFRIEKIDADKLAILGSDERGTMFGVYDFLEKQLGVDPFYFWKDREPVKRPELAFKSLSVESQEPAFRYRGEDKMNLPGMLQRTKDALAVIE